MRNWTDRYIGVPFLPGGRTFSGCDCGGLVLLALREEKGIAASDFNAYGSGEFKNMRGLGKIGEGVEGLMEEWVPVEEPRPFDLVRYRYGRWPCHVGIYAREGKVLHVEEAQAFARIMDLHDIKWWPRFIEFRRHKSLVHSFSKDYFITPAMELKTAVQKKENEHHEKEQ